MFFFQIRKIVLNMTISIEELKHRFRVKYVKLYNKRHFRTSLILFKLFFLLEFNWKHFEMQIKINNHHAVILSLCVIVIVCEYFWLCVCVWYCVSVCYCTCVCVGVYCVFFIVCVFGIVCNCLSVCAFVIVCVCVCQCVLFWCWFLFTFFENLVS